MKACTKCGIFGDSEAFSANKNRPDGLSAQCKACCRAYYAAHREKRCAYSREYAALNREVIRARRAAYRTRRREELLEQMSSYRKRNYRALEVTRLAKRLDMPSASARRILDALVGSDCHICGAPDGTHSLRHSIDHDHCATGAGSVRGYLCSPCNVGLAGNERQPNGPKWNDKRSRNADPLWRSKARVYLGRYEASIAENCR